MPKQSLKINRFEGGLNTRNSNRGIEDNQTPYAINCDVSKAGQIGVIGNALTSYTSSGSAINDSTGVADPGYGLFVFKHDYDMLGDANSNASSLKASANVGTTYICKATSTGISVYDTTNNFWYENLILFDDPGGADDPLPIFYMADGALRVCDANGPDDKVKWLGHIKRSLFNNQVSWNKWYAKNAEVSNQLDVSNNQSTKAPATIQLVAATGSGNVNFGSTSSATISVFYAWEEDATNKVATWTVAASAYNIHASPLYDDGKQEGPLVSLGSIGAPTTTSGILKLGVDVNYTASPEAVLDERLVGIRIYYTAALDATGTAYKLAEVDFAKGVKKSGGATYEGWTITSNTAHVPANSPPTAAGQGVLKYIDPPFAGTFDSQNGHYSTEETKIAFKTAVVVGRRCYAGNVAFQKETSGNSYKSDLMVRSAFNQFDKFPEFNSSTVAINDGDDIVQLVGIGSKLLQFKKNSLYILDITEQGESVDAQHKFMGIAKPCHVTNTPLGIMWVNVSGLHLYGVDGKLQNLIDGRLDVKTWNYNDNMSIGFNDEYKKVIICKDVNIYNSSSNPDAGDALIFDLITMSWMEGGRILSRIGNKTNFQTTPEGDIVYAIDGTKTGYARSTAPVQFNFYGSVRKYSTAFSSQLWEQSQYPWLLLPSDTDYSPGDRNEAPFSGKERTLISWDNNKHYIDNLTDAWLNSSNAALNTGLQYSTTTPQFADYDRFTIQYAGTPTSNAEDSDGNDIFNNSTWYCVPISVNGSIGTDVDRLSICPAGKTSKGSILNRLREVTEEVLTEGSETLATMIASTDTNQTSWASKQISSGATWHVDLIAGGDGTPEDVSFKLRVELDPANSNPLELVGSSILKWTDQPTNSENFRYYTKDIDFGDASRDKKIAKTYITYRSVSSRDALDDISIPTNSNVHAMLHLTTASGLFTVKPNVTKSTNYSATLGFQSNTNDWVRSKIVWEKTDVNSAPIPNKIESAQLVLYRDPALNSGALIPGGFALSDITFTYRAKTIK